MTGSTPTVGTLRGRLLREHSRVALGAYLLLGLVLLGSGVLAGPDSSRDAFAAVGGVGALAVVVGLVCVGSAPRWPWLVMVGGLVALSAGSAQIENAPASHLADALLLPGLGLLGVALVSMTRNGTERFKVEVVLDALVRALVVMAVVWIYLVAPRASAADLDLLGSLLLALYPAVEVFLLAVACYVAYDRREVRASFSAQALVASVGLLLGGTMTYTLDLLGVVALDPRVSDALLTLAFLSFGAAFLHPSSADVVRSEAARTRSGSWRSGVAVALGLVLPVPLVALAPNEGGGSMLVGAALCMVLVLTASWRLLRSWTHQSSARVAVARERDLMAHQARHDPLTGLANRTAVEAALEEAIGASAASAHPLAVLFLDLDRFKPVNDSFGHEAGDELLVAVAERLRRCVGSATLARLGGDEFVVVVPECDESAAVALGESVIRELSAPFALRGREVTVGVTVGVAVGRAPLVGAELLTAADTALYQGKAMGRAQVCLYDEQAQARARRRIDVQRGLETAVSAGELRAVFQPVVDASGVAVGAEALLRWSSPELGEVGPDEFVAAAEESGRIGELGAWVLDAALEEVKRWRADGHSMRVAVNVSAHQLDQVGFVDSVRDALERAGVPGHWLDLELTESALVREESTGRVLTELKTLGLGLSLDDFGTGYSSLAYLKRFPFDKLKIDKAFIQDLGGERADCRLVSAIVAMAEALGLETVAEGMETTGQSQVVHDLGCTYAQGYVHSRPLGAEEFRTWLADWDGVRAR